jgi:hypothetical protein
MLGFSIIQTGFMFYILGLTLAIPEIALALGTTLSNFHL